MSIVTGAVDWGITATFAVAGQVIRYGAASWAIAVTFAAAGKSVVYATVDALALTITFTVRAESDSFVPVTPSGLVVGAATEASLVVGTAGTATLTLAPS